MLGVSITADGEFAQTGPADAAVLPSRVAWRVRFAWPARRGAARSGVARLGVARLGPEWRGSAWRGSVARLGPARPTGGAPAWPARPSAVQAGPTSAVQAAPTDTGPPRWTGLTSHFVRSQRGGVGRRRACRAAGRAGRGVLAGAGDGQLRAGGLALVQHRPAEAVELGGSPAGGRVQDRKSTRLNSR